MPKIVVAITDTHAGYRLGLMPPGLELFDECAGGQLVPFHPELTEIQAELHRLHEEQKNHILDIANNNEIILIHLGDICQGDKYPHQLVSTRLSDQITIATANFNIWLEHPNVSTVYIMMGTEAHGFHEGSAEIMVAERLKYKYPNKSIKPVSHLLLDVDNVMFDCAHHGPGPGSRKWLRGNVARLDLRNYMANEIGFDRKPARFILRGHMHSYVEVTENDYWRGNLVTSTMLTLPSFTFPSMHIRKVTKQVYTNTCGMAYFYIHDGRLMNYECMLRTYDLRTVESL